MSAVTLAGVYVGLALALFAWEWLLDVWNERHSARVQAAPAVPGRPPWDPRALEYLRAKNRLLHAESAVFLALTFACVLGGVPEWFGGLAGTLAGARPLLAGVLMLGLFFFVLDLLRVPFDAFATFRLEAAFGFNRTTPGTFVADLAKGWLVKALP
jgi:STE24 endopeptidase